MMVAGIITTPSAPGVAGDGDGSGIGRVGKVTTSPAVRRREIRDRAFIYEYLESCSAANFIHT